MTARAWRPETRTWRCAACGEERATSSIEEITGEPYPGLIVRTLCQNCGRTTDRTVHVGDAGVRYLVRCMLCDATAIVEADDLEDYRHELECPRLQELVDRAREAAEDEGGEVSVRWP